MTGSQTIWHLLAPCYTCLRWRIQPLHPPHLMSIMPARHVVSLPRSSSSTSIRPMLSATFMPTSCLLDPLHPLPHNLPPSNLSAFPCSWSSHLMGAPKAPTSLTSPRAFRARDVLWGPVHWLLIHQQCLFRLSDTTASLHLPASWRLCCADQNLQIIRSNTTPFDHVSLA